MPEYNLASNPMCGQRTGPTTFPNGSIPSVPRASQYWRKSNLKSFLGPLPSCMRPSHAERCLFEARASRRHRRGAQPSCSCPLCILDIAGGAPAYAPMPPPCLGRLPLLLGVSRALAISAATGADAPRAESNIAATTPKTCTPPERALRSGDHFLCLNKRSCRGT